MEEITEKKILETGKALSQIVLDSTVNDKSSSAQLHEYMQMFSSDSGTYAKQREAEEKTIASLTEIQEVINRLKENVQRINEMESVFNKFLEDIENLKESHNRINYETDNLKQSLNAMTTQLNAIQNISRQTNLLAINASIEAARAGNAGIGFRIIANEVKRLSDASDTNTKKIEDNIQDFTERLNGLVTETMKGTAALDDLKDSTTKTSEMLKNIGMESAENASLTQSEVENITDCNNFLIKVSKEIENESIEKIQKISNNAASNIYQINDRVSLILEIKSIFENLLAKI